MSDAAGDTGQNAASTEEWVDLIDATNRVTGRAQRSEVRSRNLLHRGVGIICINSRDDVYVHRRTTTKDVFAGLYDMFVGGVVVSGESFDAAARRELSEELGVRGPVPERLFHHLYEGDRNRSWVEVYRVRWDGPIVHQIEEISWGAWVPGEDLAQWTVEHDVVPDGQEIFEHYLAWSSAMPGSSFL